MIENPQPEWFCLKCKQEFFTIAEATHHFENSSCHADVPISTVIKPIRMMI